MPGAGAGFFGGFANTFGNALLKKQEDKHQNDIESKRQLVSLYSKAIDTGDLDPKYGFPLVAGIISDSFGTLTGDTKGKGGKGGKGKGGNPLQALMADPQKLSDLMLGIHKATTMGGQEGPTTGPASGTGLPASGGAQEEKPQGDNLPSRSTTPSGLPQTSIWRTPAEKNELEAQATAGHEAASVEGKSRGEELAVDRYIQRHPGVKADEAAHILFGRTMPTSARKWIPGTVSGKDIPEGASDINGMPVDPSKTYRRSEDGEFAPTTATARASSMRPDEKRGAQLADAQGKNWDSLSAAEKQVYTTIGAKTIEREGAEKLAMTKQRTAAFLENAKLGRQMTQERLDNLVATEPTLVALKDAQLLNAQTLAATRLGDPQKIVAAAEKQIDQAEAKRGFFSSVGNAIFGEDHDTQVDSLITAMTGGADPAEIRSAAKSKVERAVTPPAASPLKVGGFVVGPPQ